VEYIKNTATSAQRQDLFLYKKPVYKLESFTTPIDFYSLLQRLEKLIPKHLTHNFEVIYVGSFDDFYKNNRLFNAMYKDGAIYVSNVQDGEEDLVDDIIHEIAHSIEKEYDDIIYGDGLLEEEFLGKRRSLKYLIDKPTYNMLIYNNVDYQAKFDNHLYDDLGYDYLRNVSSGLFYSPYAITSLREYWANGFENYLLGDNSRLKALSPVLYKKIQRLINLGEE